VACSISQVAARFGLSRSTLLYYDRIGLLTPSSRSPANYREYSQSDLERMERIAVYREAGLSLRVIAEILEGRHASSVPILEGRLGQINGEIRHLREQQKVLLSLLKNKSAWKKTRVMTKKRWVAILAASGMDEAGMRRWHVQFEGSAPEAHQDFLESLGIPAGEVSAIRAWSRIKK
jgi:DNA-binding transcriptional MerR regulator